MEMTVTEHEVQSSVRFISKLLPMDLELGSKAQEIATLFFRISRIRIFPGVRGIAARTLRQRRAASSIAPRLLWGDPACRYPLGADAAVLPPDTAAAVQVSDCTINTVNTLHRVPARRRRAA